MSARTWRGLRAKAVRLASETDESLNASDAPLQLHLPPLQPGKLLFFTRPALHRRWLDADASLDRLLVMIRYGLPTAAYAQQIADVATRAKLPVGFVGDLDPLDLTTFLALRSGDPELRRPERPAMKLTWSGIDDRWLALCEQHLLPKWRGALPMIALTPLEQEHLALLLHLAPSLPKWIGPRSTALLRSGCKLELEGASSPAFYGDAFPLRLLQHLTGRRRSVREAR